MKNIKLSKIALFVIVGGVIPLIFVYLIKSNSISFVGSNFLLGLALALLIIICAYTVGFRFTKLTKQEKITNVIVGFIIYTIIFVLYMKFVLKPQDFKLFDLIVTGYYGVIATIIAIFTRSDADEGDKIKK